MRIEKRVRSKYFKDVLEGRKGFEVRLADFRCKPGDVLVLKEQDISGNRLTGRKIECEVLYKFNTKNMLKFHTKKEIDKHGLVVLAIRRKYRFR